MSDLSDAAARVAIVAALRAKVAEAYDKSRDEMSDQMDPGSRWPANLGGGALGDVIMTRGATRAKVTDEDTFTRWVAENHPTEIVQSVRPAYLSKVLADAKRFGAAVDSTSGEFIPGVEMETGKSYVTVKLAEDASQVIADNWDSARRHVPELPGGEP